MKPRVYVETSVISYLAARRSSNAIVAAHQSITEHWWESRDRFDLYISQFVIDEAARGDSDAARRRIELTNLATLLSLNERVYELTKRMLRDGAVPPNSLVDAAHLAAAAVHEMRFLVTWNCKHIANAFAIRKIEETCQASGFLSPTICTPEQLLDDAPWWPERTPHA